MTETSGVQEQPPVLVSPGRADLRALELPLRRLPCAGARAAVLLLHGASAASNTFLAPSGQSLAEHLHAWGYDVWLLDWRGGKEVAGHETFRRPEYLDAFSMDHVANHDIPVALGRIRSAVGPKLPLRVLAHCFGAGCLAIAIAADQLRSHGVDRVVLMTLGLFYETPWDGFIKADDFLIERIRGTAPKVTAIHPGAPVPNDRARPWETPTVWPSEMQDAFESWPPALLPDCGVPICQRVSFMFGHPYLEQNLPESMHRADELAKQFGSMPITLYVHAGQNVRRGYAAPLDALPGCSESQRYLSRAGYDALDRVTLISGTENEIWHPESVHRMHDWLGQSARRNSVKHVLTSYGHQDLLWGRNAPRDVFPLIMQGLG
jgi:cholesterol oxidase